MGMKVNLRCVCVGATLSTALRWITGIRSDGQAERTCHLVWFLSFLLFVAVVCSEVTQLFYAPLPA